MKAEGVGFVHPGEETDSGGPNSSPVPTGRSLGWSWALCGGAWGGEELEQEGQAGCKEKPFTHENSQAVEQVALRVRLYWLCPWRF